MIWWLGEDFACLVWPLGLSVLGLFLVSSGFGASGALLWFFGFFWLLWFLWFLWFFGGLWFLLVFLVSLVFSGFLVVLGSFAFLGFPGFRGAYSVSRFFLVFGVLPLITEFE